jgi:hypothetical protein
MREQRTPSITPARRPGQVITTLSPAERSLRARLAAYAMHARHDARRTSANGRAAFLARFEVEVDPDGRLDPEERRRRAEQARRAYFARLALASAKARRAKRAALGKRPEGGEAA